MFSTFHARNLERCVKMNYASFPSLTTHEEALFYNFKKWLMKAWQILSTRRCGGMSWVERMAWVDLLNRSPFTYLSQSPEKQNLLFRTCPLLSLGHPYSLCSLPLGPHIFFPLTQEVSLSLLSGFLWIVLGEKMGKEIYTRKGRLCKSCLGGNVYKKIRPSYDYADYILVVKEDFI